MRHKFNIGDKVKCKFCRLADNCKVEKIIIYDFEIVHYFVQGDNCFSYQDGDFLELVE